MADMKISEMTSASQINNDDNVELSQGNTQSGFASVKATILAIAQKIITGINFTSALETENKTIAGAINEVAQGGGGSSTFAGLSDVDIDDTTLANGQVPKWNSTTEKWENGNTGGGSGGHSIIDSDGNEMTARSGLQFKNAYVSDNSTGDKTVVPIYREMTKQEYAQAQDKTGLIVVTDDKAKVVNADSVYPVETSPSEHAYSEGDHLIVDGVTYVAIDDIAIGDSLVLNTNIEAETLDTRMNHIEDGIELASTATGTEYSSGVNVKDKIDSYHDWQVVAQNVSTADISNTDFNEYDIIVIVGGRSPAICYKFRLTRGSNLLSTTLKYIQGSWANGNYGTAVELTGNTSSISISSVYINSTNEITNAKMYIVGRY